MSYAASGVIFQDHRRISVRIFLVKITASKPLKRVTLESVSNFKEASKKFKIKYCNSKLFQTFEKLQRKYNKYLYNF
jgi:hypothetical protein